MVSDEFALEKFKQNYGHVFCDIRLIKGPSGESEILARYNKPRFKRDWIPNRFCRRIVRLVRMENEQPATPTPPVEGAKALTQAAAHH